MTYFHYFLLTAKKNKFNSGVAQDLKFFMMPKFLIFAVEKVDFQVKLSIWSKTSNIHDRNIDDKRIK